MERIRVAGIAGQGLSADRFDSIWELLIELENEGKVEAFDIAVKSYLTSPSFTLALDQDDFLDFVERHSYRALRTYVSRGDYAGARRQAKRMMSWVEVWNPPPDLARTNFQLQAFVNVVYRLDALFHDLTPLYRSDESMLPFLRNTLDATPIEPAIFDYLGKSQSEQVRHWAQYLGAAENLKKRQFDAAIQLMGEAATDTNERLREMAAFGAIRSHYWKAKNKQTTSQSARTAIANLRSHLKRKNLDGDAGKYVDELNNSR